MPFNDVPSGTQTAVYGSKVIEDGVIASGLITAPAWGPWIGQLNHILTTFSLLIGLAIGVHRLWRIYTIRRSNIRGKAAPSQPPTQTLDK